MTTNNFYTRAICLNKAENIIQKYLNIVVLFLALIAINNVNAEGNKYEEAVQGVTSASVLLYDIVSDVPYVVLAQRNEGGKAGTWTDFGGGSEVSKGDKTLADTAAREVFEESMQLITLQPIDISDAFSVDIITDGKKHRLYLVRHKIPTLNEFVESYNNLKKPSAKGVVKPEYLETMGYAVVSLEHLITAVNAGQTQVNAQGKLVQDDSNVREITLYPSMVNALKQEPLNSALQG